MSKFTVESVNICDFVSSDAAGKAILIGVYQGNIRFTDAPSAWPPLYFSIVLRPQAQNFDFAIRFVRPDGINFIDLNGNYAAPSDPPTETRAIINFQIPPMRFTGPGDYKIVISAGHDERVYCDVVPVAIGPAVEFVASINADITLSAEL